RKNGVLILARMRLRSVDRNFKGACGMSLVAVGDPALGQIVRGHFESHAVSGKDANAIAPELAGQMRQHRSLLVELNTEKSAGKLLHYRSCYFYTVFFTHS